MKIISEEYRKLNSELHNNPKYGKRSIRWFKVCKKLIDQYKLKSVLDYGCGKGMLKKKLSKYAKLVNYDPCIEEFNIEPVPCQLVLCTDVLEHIEIEYLDNVLKHIHNKTLIISFFCIALHPDNTKTLPDGSDPHRIVETHSWWIYKISKYFKIKQWNLKHLKGNKKEVRILAIP